jgi:hypothetical protein
MRRGEALGLQWKDIDWSRGKVHVRRSRVRDRTGTPKSGKARQVDMSPQLEETLRTPFCAETQPTRNRRNSGALQAAIIVDIGLPRERWLT